MFRSSTHRRWNNWHIWNPEEILNPKHVLLVQKYWFENFNFFTCIDLTSVKSKLRWRHRTHHYRYLRVKLPRKRVSLGMFVTFIFWWTFVTWPWPFQVWPLYLLMYHYQIFTSTLCEFEPLVARLTDPTVQNVKAVFFYLWPYLDLTHDLYLKMLKIHKVFLDERFRTPPNSSCYDA